MNADLVFWLAILGVVAAGLAATAARTLRDFSRRELEELCERRQDQDRFADILHNHDRAALGVDMLVACLAALGVACGAIWSWLSWRPESTAQGWWLLLAVTVTAALLVAGTPDAALAAESIQQVVNNIRTWVVGILVAVATLFLTVGGLRYAAANGDPGEVEKAKLALKSAAIGYGLAMLAPLFVTIVGQWVA